jgi:alpha-L-arabinofuranosidase
MKRSLIVWSFTVMLTVTLFSLGVLQSSETAGLQHAATIKVDLRQPGAAVPAGLYGIFMEEINQGFDGGIYAELVRNRSFEEGVLPPGMKLVTKENGELRMELEKLPAGVPQEKWEMPWPWFMNCGWDPNRELVGWSLKTQRGASGKMETTAANPMNAASSRSLKLQLDAGQEDGAAVSLVNEGYWGINVVQGQEYDLTFYLRPGTFAGKLMVTLQSVDGTVLGKHDFGTVQRDQSWKKYTATITATADDPRAQLALTFQGRGDLQIDWVSLFPPTWKGRANGLRPDLAQLLADMKPDFVRYPGGCYTQGLSWEQAPDWRKMVCDPVDRPGMWGYWKYRSTDGFGYHEFLQFSEDIGADAMYVAFCGMTVHPENNMPLEDIGPVVQQTLDAIEYAIGPRDSKWGRVRVRMGHPEPFPLKYVEIGNEHPPALYGDYYVKFREAIKAKYPGITAVMSMYWSGLNQGAIERAGDENIDIVDEHAYRGAGWVRNNFDYFDKYPRKPWKVYVGEYAAHSQNGDWNAAMNDSVFLMMMERNGDLVTMASYAPLLCNVNFKNWGVNLIEFDSARSFAHASYYVQKMFNENRPDVNLATTLEEMPQPNPDTPLFGGRFGLGSWHTHSQFKDLEIHDAEGRLIHTDNFAKLDDWQPVRGQWAAKDGILAQTDQAASPSMILLKTPELNTGRVTLKARRADGQEGFLMFFNTHGIDRYMFCNYGAAGNRHLAIQGRPDEGCSLLGGRATDRGIDKGDWYDIRLEVARDAARMYLDDELVSETRVERLNSLFSQAGYDRQNREVIIKVTNFHGQPVDATIELEGTRTVERIGRHLLIRSASPGDQNTLDAPRRIVPAEQVLEDCSRTFPVTLPPYSVNLLRIPAE